VKSDRELRSLLAFACLAGFVATGSCAVGDGNGKVSGTLNVPACTFNSIGPNSLAKTIGSANNDFNLESDFFVGAPVDADPLTAPGFPANQMIIRVQHSGARLESANALVFWIFDSAEVARCLYGNGTADWNHDVCDRSASVLGPGGEGRLFIGMTSETVRSFFVLNDTCPHAFISANALGTCADGSCPDVTLCPGRGSWISFSQYGDPPDDSSKIKAGFGVNYGEHIAANVDPQGMTPSFHVELCDKATVDGKLDNILPVPKPRIVGTLEGWFDFTLERGEAAQPFP
jgi:hypothetical protein